MVGVRPADREDPRGDGRGGCRARDAVCVVGAAGRDGLERRGRRAVRSASGPLRRRCLRRHRSPHEGGQRATPLRRGPPLPGPARVAVAVGAAARRPTLLPAVRGLLRAGHHVLHPGRTRRTIMCLRTGPADPLPRSRRTGVPRAADRRRSHRRPVAGRDDLARHQVPERLHRHLGLHVRPVSNRVWSST